MSRRTWVKIWVNMLRSTTMDELQPDERFVWIGLLLLAGDSPIEGKVTITEQVGYTDEQLAGILKCQAELITRTKTKLIETDKIKISGTNVIEIINWHKYQSEYQRQKAYRKKLQPEVTTESYNPKLQAKVTTESYTLDRDTDTEKEEKDNIKEKIREITGQWNAFAENHGLAKVRGIPSGSKRERLIRARLKEKEWDFSNILEKVGQSDFLLGARGWKVSFDWLICPSNYIKVLEGNYDNRQATQKTELQRQIEALDKKILRKG